MPTHPASFGLRDPHAPAEALGPFGGTSPQGLVGIAELSHQTNRLNRAHSSGPQIFQSFSVSVDISLTLEPETACHVFNVDDRRLAHVAKLKERECIIQARMGSYFVRDYLYCDIWRIAKFGYL